MPKTQLSGTATPGRRYGSFAGKAMGVDVTLLSLVQRGEARYSLRATGGPRLEVTANGQPRYHLEPT